MRFNSGRLWLLLTFLFCGSMSVPTFAQSEGEEYKIGSWRELESKVLGETRKIIVSKPTDYDSTDQQYAVLYLLDGDSHFHHTTGLVDFMASNKDIPGIIVVGVVNTDRTRDLTPALEKEDESSPTAGGAENFTRFLREELIPFVDENYRTRPYRILVGHSYGGLFTVHTLVHHHDLFNAYVAISPSFQWDDQRLVRQAQAFFGETKELKRTLYMTVGNEGGQLLGGVLKVAGSLEEKSPSEFEWDSKVMKEETHGSVPYRSTRQGLEFVFKDWSVKNPLDLYELGGVAAIYKHFEKCKSKYGIEHTTPKMAFIMLSFHLQNAGRLDEAQQVLEHDKVNFSPPALLYTMLGKKHLANDDKEKATACFTTAVKINPAASDAKSALKELGVDISSIVEMVTVSKETLAEYVGTYTYSATGGNIEVTLASGALFTEAPGQPKAELTPTSQTKFVEPSGIYCYSFQRDADQKVNRMTLGVLDGTQFICPRHVEVASDDH